ncbi:MAG: Type 1 glutamine amidotransferase-like domain-containing protein [Clostridia bacterium]|nr:Type 1 glutamine amidotransferase-like domain-containing protein [Clostridia bacterium]
MQKIFVFFNAMLMIAILLLGRADSILVKGAQDYYSPAEIETYAAASKDASGNGLLVLYGGGFDTEKNFRPLLEKCIAHTGKTAPRLLFLPTAEYDAEDGAWREVFTWWENAGCETDVLYVSRSAAEEAAEKIAAADIVYEIGGNLDFLTKNWREKGVFEAVRGAFDRGAALIGVSSGAMCWAARGWDDFGEPVFRITDELPHFGVDDAYDFRDCAGVIPFCVCPHFDNPAWRVFSVEAIRLDLPSLCIENGAAVAYSNGTFEVISDAPTPFRTAYLFFPEKRIMLLDLKKHADIATVVDGEMRSR